MEVKMIDLGLPSGRLWADRNVGADKPEDYGLFFQWGDTQGYTASQVGSDEGKKYFGWADYKFNPSGDGSAMTKYNSTDGKTVLDIEDDAARVNMGGNWRMPTTDEIQELFNSDYTTNIWTTSNGVNGWLITSKSNGNSVFLPADGYAYNGSVYYVGSYGLYWSSSLGNVQFAFNLLFGSSGISPANYGSRFNGFSVRAVEAIFPKIIKKQSNYGNKEWYDYLSDEQEYYIDHGYELEDFLKEVCNDETLLMNYLFSDESFIATGNDNSDEKLDTDTNAKNILFDYHKSN